MAGLYIHVPFCVKKCSYCAFCSVPVPDSRKQAAFVRMLSGEIDGLPENFSPETVFVGGGTPTVLDADCLKALFGKLARFRPDEFSCEVNPGTLTPVKTELLRESGVNRLSIGVQSFHAGCLKTLGRIYSGEEAENAVRAARRAGFENISLDLIFGVPGQTLSILDEDLDRAASLEPDHISLYNLMYEEGTSLTESRPARLDEELEREMYDRIRARLTAAGFNQYEISNFSRPGSECRHNLLYWTGGEYIGCGPAAHSHWNGIRRANAADVDEYCLRGARRDFEEQLDPLSKEKETLVMNLRLLAGAEVSETLWSGLEETFLSLEEKGLIHMDGHHVRLSENALFVSNSIFSELV